MELNTKICIPIFEKTIKDAYEAAEKYIEMGADLLELRIDAIKNPRKSAIIDLANDIDSPIIATNRSPLEGGSFKGSEDERTNLLAAIAPEVEYVDIELNTRKKYLEMILEISPKTIVSYHNFKETPPLNKLLEIVEREKNLGEIAKIAVTPQDIKDTLIVLQLLSMEDNLIAISMGELGKYTRIIGPLLGSPITYATGGKSTAPGQLEIEKTRLILKELSPR